MGETRLPRIFWEKVEKVEGGCWTWKGSKSTSGYGQAIFYAHRLSYEDAHGSIPEGLVLLHVCDNRACVNPTHLKVGTQLENVIDTRSKGRARHLGLPGVLNPSHKLTEEQVKQIRARHKRGKNQFDGGNTSQLARDFRVTRITIQNIVSRREWKHLA